MPVFEYRSHFEPLQYQKETLGKLMFKQEREDFSAPMANAFAERCEGYLLPGFGADGWELVSTQPIWKAVDHVGNLQTDGAGGGRTVVDGYLFFFKRQRA